LKAPENGTLHRAPRNAMRGAQRAAGLTSRLLAFSRRQPLDAKPTDLNKFLSAASDFLQRSLGEKVQIETVGAAGLWFVEVDANHLESALLNLAINARDAMPDGGKLTLEGANVYVDEDYNQLTPELPIGQYVLICVSDTGVGMVRDVLNRAFEPFFTTKELGQGTGLGLSQVYGFVKQSGGHLRIYSEPGEGTTVRLYLPRCFSAASEAAFASPTEGVQQGSGETILVVEDDPNVRAYVVEALSGVGYRVVEAGDAEAALVVFDSNPEIHLMLTDVVMPGMNGRALADMIRQSRPTVKTLFMTGYSRNAIVHQGRLDAGVSLIQKPFSQASLAARIRSLLDA